jgi:GAF domain-containing protein
MKGAAQPASAGESTQIPSVAQPMFFDALISATRKIAVGTMEREAKLKRICALLAKSVSYYNWVGFYLVSPENPRELALGPFVGEPTEHTRIPFGKGICGQAAERKQIFTVQDVAKESNYLACSLKVKAEIVVPILKNGQVLGELDIDSHQLAPFTAEDQRGLRAICEIVAGML